MKTAGIIAEYNPLHYGHLHLLQAVRQRFGEDTAVICAMSGDFVQRGDFALLRRYARAEAAVESGADLVLELPLPWAVSSAEGFARGGVETLTATGLLDVLAFGSECGDSAALLRCALALERPELTPLLKAELTRGDSFAAARQAAAAQLASDERVAALLDKPNNNLAVEYCRAIRSLAPRMEAYPLPRQGADHGEALHSAHGQFASASALRKLWAEGGADAVAPYVPEAVFPLYQEAYAAGQYTDFSAAGRCELALLRSACRDKAPFADIRGVSEGLEHRLEAAVRTSTTYDELLDALTTVRYPRARMRRLAMDAALGCTADSLPALPPYLHLLGGKKDALPFLKNCTLPVSHSLARLRGSGGASARMAEAQLAAADFGTLCRVSPEAMGGLLRQKNIFLT